MEEILRKYCENFRETFVEIRFKYCESRGVQGTLQSVKNGFATLNVTGLDDTYTVHVDISDISTVTVKKSQAQASTKG